MIQRIIRYKDNQSLTSLAINTGVLAYIVYQGMGISNPSFKLIFLSSIAFLFFIPFTFSTFLSNRPQAVVRLMKISHYLLYAYIAVLFTNVIVIPPLGFILVVFFVIFSMGIAFWFFSHPSIMTQKTYIKVQGRNEAIEEKILRKEVKANDKALNENQY